MTDKPVMVYHYHLKQLQFCNRGARQWFERHQLSWRDFLQSGIELKIIEEIGDEFAWRTKEHVLAELERLKHGQK